jgi:hypothetical protein
VACRAPDPVVASVVVDPPKSDASLVVHDAGPPDADAKAPSSGPPLPAPVGLSIRAVSPYAVSLSWDWPSGGPPVNGFEVLAVHGKQDVRAGLANPGDRSFVIHGLRPEDWLELRVRAFDARGGSRASESVLVQTPRDTSKRAQAPLPPCIPAITSPPPTTGGCNPGIEVLDAAKQLVNVPSPNDACRRRLVATYKGCTRELGAFELQADITEVPGYPNEGFPLLHAIAGAGEYVGAQILALRFADGRYAVVDTVGFCGEPSPDAPEGSGTVDPDLARCRPPFDACQYGGMDL